jgi:hypothetical protein
VLFHTDHQPSHRRYSTDSIPPLFLCCAPRGRSASHLPTRGSVGATPTAASRPTPFGRFAACDTLGLRHLTMVMLGERRAWQDDGSQTRYITELHAHTGACLEGERTVTLVLMWCPPAAYRGA